MRYPQPLGERGSLKWIQRAVANRPDLLQPASLPAIEWLSPLASDAFPEYRDEAFLGRLDLDGLIPALSHFWPAKGPQWDALGRTARGPVLVEAKAHVAEFLSPATRAGDVSRARIEAAFELVQRDLGLGRRTDWCDRFYQYANRLAHLWWLRQQGVHAELVLVGFLGDAEMLGPKSAEAWNAVYQVADYVLGLPSHHALRADIHHVTPDTALLTEPAVQQTQFREL